MIALLVMTDGRKDCISKTIPSALAHLKGPISHKVVHDDSANLENLRWIRKNFPDFGVIHPPLRQGFGGAIRFAWDYIQHSGRDFQYVFHLEDDFLFNRDVDLSAMIEVLNAHPYLYQLALRRQPWNDDEKRAGGIIEQHPEDYIQKDGWIEHRRFFTTNPCLYRRSLLDVGWPLGGQSEGHFTHKILNSDPEAWFAFWGHKEDEPWVTHIGARQGTGY